MNTKELGATGVKIPELGFGTWAYHGGVEPLRRALDLGAWFLDTAERYQNEHIVGEAIRGRRDRVFLATKVSVENFRHDDVLKAADRSLQALRTDWIDLYQLHWPSESIPIEETMAALEQLADSGKIRFIGLSRYRIPEFQRAQAALRKHRIVSQQLRYGVVTRDIEVDLLPWCRANRVSVLAFSSLEHGLQNILARDPRRVLDEIAAGTGKTKAQVALNWCLVKEGVIPLTTAGSIAHVEENFGAAGWRLTPAQIQLLDQNIRFRRPGRLVKELRRIARRTLQRLGLR